MVGNKTLRKGGGSVMKLICELSPWARSALLCRKLWLFSPLWRICSPISRNKYLLPKHHVSLFPGNSCLTSPLTKDGSFQDLSLLQVLLLCSGFHPPMGPGVGSPLSLWISWSGVWGKVAALPLDLHETQGAVQSCDHALLRKGGCICPKPWPLVPKENNYVQGIFHHSRRTLTSQGCVYQSCLCQKKWEGILAWKKKQDWDIGQVLRLWLWDADDGNISVTPESSSFGA